MKGGINMAKLSRSESVILAKALMTLFRCWKTSRSTQCSLLGISPTNSNKLRAMESGASGIPQGRDSHERVGNLLSIHKSLKLLYPHNPEIRYGWVNMRNSKLNGRTPMEVMVIEGYVGIAKIKRFLNMSCQK